jgi:pyruvate,orthophosphate dikinase
MAEKQVYFFGGGQAEGSAKMKEFLGGKGANLAEMTSLGVPVPPGFTISAEMCDAYYQNGRKNSPELIKEVEEHLHRLESTVGKKLGDKDSPLAGIGTLRSSRIHARYDGYHPEPRSQ